MAISVSIGSADPLSLSGLKDLASQGELTNLKLGPEWQGFLNQPLSAVPAKLNSVGVQYTGGGASWTPGMGAASPLTFSLSAGGGGKLSVITSGDLLSYTDGFPPLSMGQSTPAAKDGTTTTVAVEAGQAFVGVELDFQVSGGLTGSYTQGIYGLSTQDNGKTGVKVAFYKSCAPSTSLQDAVKQAFEGFVLPLHEKTLEHLSPGDFLHYSFDGNLQLGVGASIGYDKVLYAGTTVQEIPGTAGAISVKGTLAPEVQAGAKFCFAYDYCGTFEVMLSRDAGGRGRLHLYRSSEQDTKIGGNFRVGLMSGTAASMAVATDHLTTLLTQSMPDQVQPMMSSRVLPAAMGGVNSYVGELNDKVTAWLGRANYEAASLDTAIQHAGSRFLLTDYAVDLLNPKYAAAWKLMIAGEFLDAMQLPNSGVTLATGSGVEALFQQAAGIKLNLFGALHASWTAETFSNSSLVYAGNNVFHLLTQEGRDVLDVRNRTSHEVTMYFAAEADVSISGSPIPPPALQCLLQASNNASFGKSMARLMRLLSDEAAVQALAAKVEATTQQPNSNATLHLSFAAGNSGYGGLNASSVQHGKPDDEAKDRRNYEAFAQGCREVFQAGPASLQWGSSPLSYGLWRDTWIASNDQWPAREGSVPNRREHAGFLPAVQAQLDGALPGLGGDTGQAMMIFHALDAAAQFMNLCDDLRMLASQTTVYTPDTWTHFVDELSRIVKNDMNTDFLPATMLALASLSGGQPVVSGPLAGLPVGNSIGVTMTFGAGH